MGRPTKLFAECCAKTKKMKTAEIRKSASTEELAYATKLALYEDKNRAGAQLLAQITEYSPTRSLTITQTLRDSSKKKEILLYTPDEALALIMDCRLTKDSYKHLRDGARRKGIDMYPSYDRVLNCKKECYPDLDAIDVDCFGE
jgi:hypothetical protein